jgi:hypothetical protein
VTSKIDNYLIRAGVPQIIGNLAWEIGTETGPVTFADGKSINFTAFATNIYQNIDGHWLMVSHQAGAKPKLRRLRIHYGRSASTRAECDGAGSTTRLALIVDVRHRHKNKPRAVYALGVVASAVRTARGVGGWGSPPRWATRSEDWCELAKRNVALRATIRRCRQRQMLTANRGAYPGEQSAEGPRTRRRTLSTTITSRMRCFAASDWTM